MADDNTPGENATSDDRGAAVADFAGFLMHQLTHAVQEHGMAWQDAVYAVGIAVEGVAEVAALMSRFDADGATITPAQAREQAYARLAKARGAEIVMLEAKDEAEMAAMVARIKADDDGVPH